MPQAVKTCGFSPEIDVRLHATGNKYGLRDFDLSKSTFLGGITIIRLIIYYHLGSPLVQWLNREMQCNKQKKCAGTHFSADVTRTIRGQNAMISMIIPRAEPLEG